MKVIWNRMGRVLKRNIWSLLGYELIFRLGTWIAVIPLVSWLLRLCMKICGYRYVTNQNIFQFLSHPLTILLLLLTLFSVLYLSAVEYSGLLVCYEYSVHNISISPTEMLLEGMELSRRSWHRKGIFLLILLALPMTNFFMMALAIYKVQSLNYIAERFFISKSSLYIFGVIVLVMYLICSQVLLPLVSMYLSTDNGKQNFRSQFLSFTKGRMGKNLHYYHLWNLISVLSLMAVALLLCIVVSLVLVLTVNEKYILIRTIRAAEDIVIFLGLLAGMIGTVISLAGTFTIYDLRMESQYGILEMKRRFSNEKELLQPRKKKVTLTVLTMVACLELFLTAYSLSAGTINVTDYLSGVAVTAHRGASKLAPENTLASLQAAIDVYADYAEIDVQESADGVLFLLHDMNTGRTCDKSLMAYMEDYSTLAKLNAGKNFGGEYDGEHIPTLEEALELCRGQINLNIEIKDNPKTPNVVEKTIRMIEDMGFTDRCVVTSTNQEILKQVKELNPDIQTGMILKIAIGEVYELEGVDFFSAKYTNVTEAFVEKAHKAGMEVHVWTVNNADIVRQMAGYHVDNIITDFPVETQEILNEETYGSSFITVLKKIIAQLER